MLHPVAVFFAILDLFVEMPWPESYTFIALLILIIPIFISFMILPGRGSGSEAVTSRKVAYN